MKNALKILLVSVLGFIVSAAASPDPSQKSTEVLLGRIPVQSGGRVKPFESFAQEILVSVTGKKALAGEKASIVLWKWISNPEEWHTKSFIPVKHKALREEFGLMVIAGKISPELVLSHPPFLEKVEEASARKERKEPVTLLEKKRIELHEQAHLFEALTRGVLPGFIPNPEDPRESWFPIEALATPRGQEALGKYYSPELVAEVHAVLGELVGLLHDGKEAASSAHEFAFSLEHLRSSREIVLDQNKINLELAYNHLRPFHWAWILYLASAVLGFVLRNRLPQMAFGFFLGGFFFHTLGFVLRCLVAGRPPVSNMYESIIWVAWAVAFFSIPLRFFSRNPVLSVAAAAVASLALLIGESFPAVLDPSLSPLVPVLRSNYWLTIHVLTITLSYGAFALAWGLAHANLFNFAFHPEKREEQESLGAFLYRALQIGVVLLAAGTILGGVWANDSWGRFWGWDPKETWALIALLGYLAILHCRHMRWIGTFGTAVSSVLAFLGILMAWYGVNFVLAAGLHSYGFGGGGFPWVSVGVLIDLALVSFLVFCYHRSRSVLKV